MTDWIEWKGGEQPVEDDVIVETKFSDGSGSVNAAGRWIWEDEHLIAYRITKEQPK